MTTGIAFGQDFICPPASSRRCQTSYRTVKMSCRSGVLVSGRYDRLRQVNAESALSQQG